MAHRSEAESKEAHADVERLAADRRCETESKETHALKNAPKHTVLCMKGLTSPVWTLGMFQMVSGDSCQCMKRTKQSTACHITVRHASCTVPGCGFVAKYQNTSNLENHYVTAGTDLYIRTLPIWRITMSQLELFTDDEGTYRKRK